MRFGVERRRRPTRVSSCELDTFLSSGCGAEEVYPRAEHRRHAEGPPGCCQGGLPMPVAAAGAAECGDYGETSEVFALEKTLVMLVPSVVMMTIETIEIRTMISAYSTRPWPLPVFTASRFR
jgi:hypothetical protein